jgi:AcrR family transcriptional regulator
MARGVLQRDEIVRRALQLADAGGLGAVSFRRLAAEFGVTPMALYRHVRDRADLIDAMADLLLGEMQVPPPGDAATDWVGALRSTLQGAARVLAEHPAASDLLRAGTGLSANSLRLTEALLGILVRAGFTPFEALDIVHQLSSLMLGPPAMGGAAQQQSERTGSATPARLEELAAAIPAGAFPYMSATLAQAGGWVDAVRDRTFGVELLLAGVEMLLARKRARARGAPAAPA